MSEGQQSSDRLIVPENAGKFEVVINKLQTVGYDQVKKLLDGKQSVDPKAGIILTDPLKDGEEEMTAIGTDGRGNELTNYFRAARVLPSSPGNPNAVKPHLHNVGKEPYRIYTGKGEMNLGRIINGEVDWDEPKSVGAGDIIIVEEGQVHSLRNAGTEPLDFAFAYQLGHLIDAPNPGWDREFTEGKYTNDKPSHYNKI